MSFDLAPTGEVKSVYYPKGQDHKILAIKKVLLGTFSSRLLVSALTARWGYLATETGHEGMKLYFIMFLCLLLVHIS